jgi:hypothetical protein
MPVRIDPDYLSLDARTAEVSIPVDAKDRDKGVVRLTLRELPYAKKRAVEVLYLSALREGEKAEPLRARLDAGEGLSAEDADRLAGAMGSFFEALREVVRWGVVAHQAEDFLRGELATPFEAVALLCNGKHYDCANDRMLRLYQLAGGGRVGEEGTLLPQIARSVLDYQRGEVKTPESLWGE